MGGRARVAAARKDIPRQPRSGLHALVAGAGLAAAHSGGLDRDRRLSRPEVGAVAGTRILQVLHARQRHYPAQGGLRAGYGSAAGRGSVGRGAGMDQTHALAHHGTATHHEARIVRPHSAVGAVVCLSAALSGRKRHVRNLRRRQLSDRLHGFAARLAPRCRDAPYTSRCGGAIP